MPSSVAMTDREADAWEAIRDNGRLVRTFLGDADKEQLGADTQKLYAVVRGLEIISEASRRLRGAQQLRFPELPWRDIQDAGNVYRHGYDRLLLDRIWGTAHDDLPALMVAAEAVCAEFPQD